MLKIAFVTVVPWLTNEIVWNWERQRVVLCPAAHRSQREQGVDEILGTFWLLLLFILLTYKLYLHIYVKINLLVLLWIEVINMTWCMNMNIIYIINHFCFILYLKCYPFMSISGWKFGFHSLKPFKGPSGTIATGSSLKLYDSILNALSESKIRVEIFKFLSYVIKSVLKCPFKTTFKSYFLFFDRRAGLK